MSVAVQPLTQEWHEARRKGIGASEIAAVLGISPWESPFSLFWRKVNGWTFEPNAEMEWGNRLEDVIAAKFEENHPEYNVHPIGLRVHPLRPWHLATPDRVLCDHQMHDNPFPDDPEFEWSHYDDNIMGVLELKTAHSADGWGEHGTDEIPVHYRAQMLWQMSCLGVRFGHMAVLIGGSDYREYDVHLDTRDLNVMIEAGRRFMARLESGEPPSIDEHTATLATLRRLHPDLDDFTAEVPTAIAAGYIRAVDMGRLAAALKLRYEIRLREAMGSAHYGAHNGQKIATRVVTEVAESTRTVAAHRRDYLLPPRERKP